MRELPQRMKKKLKNIETRDAAAVKRIQRPQVTEDSLTVILFSSLRGGGEIFRFDVVCVIAVCVQGLCSRDRLGCLCLI